VSEGLEVQIDIKPHANYSHVNEAPTIQEAHEITEVAASKNQQDEDLTLTLTDSEGSEPEPEPEQTLSEEAGEDRCNSDQ
jgi:hypothetical protein